MKNRKISAYVRPNGLVGVRNYILVLSTVVCANQTVSLIEKQVKGDNIIAITHQHGCSQGGDDKEQTLRILRGIAAHPNVAAALIIGLGCETINPKMIADYVEKFDKPCKTLEIQECGGVLKTVKQGIKILNDYQTLAGKINREKVDIYNLIVGLECGGSDSYSGITANPSVGIFSDILIGRGGTVLLSEIPEMIGAEQLLAKRCKDKKTKERLLEAIKNYETKALKAGIDIREANPSPGNKEGGITTLEEKSLGCILKGGNTPIKQVIDYGEFPEEQGLIIMNTPGNDVESLSGMAAGGAQIMVFTTGRGTPAGCAVAPTIKIATNSRIYKKMKDSIDINAGKIITKGINLHEIGKEIFLKVIKIAEGEKTKSEILGQYDFSINRIGPTF